MPRCGPLRLSQNHPRDNKAGPPVGVPGLGDQAKGRLRLLGGRWIRRTRDTFRVGARPTCHAPLGRRATGVHQALSEGIKGSDNFASAVNRQASSTRGALPVGWRTRRGRRSSSPSTARRPAQLEVLVVEHPVRGDHAAEHAQPCTRRRARLDPVGIRAVLAKHLVLRLVWTGRLFGAYVPPGRRNDRTAV